MSFIFLRRMFSTGFISIFGLIASVHEQSLYPALIALGFSFVIAEMPEGAGEDDEDDEDEEE